MLRFNSKTIRWRIHCFLLDHFPRKALEREWELQYGKKFDWKNPQTLNEKIVWLMGKSDLSLWTKCADKIQVRDFVEERGLKDILTQLYGTWQDARDIDFDKLPNKFVIKCNHDCGSTHIIDKTKGFDKERLIGDLNQRLKKPFGYNSCEPHYTKIKPMILAEEYIPLSDNVHSSSQIDYKFWCFNGKIHHCFIVYNRQSDGHTANYDMYKLNPWRPCREGFPPKYQKQVFESIPEPENISRMIEIAQTLSKGFPEVRVDLYNVNGKIYFGELTMSSAAGRMDYFSDEFQREMGSMIEL